jgi:hypothetical protein
MPSSEARAILNDLIRQRQRILAEREDADLLEANRLGIVYWQLQLARALSAEQSQATTAA